MTHFNEHLHHICTNNQDVIQIFTNFTITKASGLNLCKEKPFLAASPDGIVECDCCGKGILEIKLTAAMLE